MGYILTKVKNEWLWMYLNQGSEQGKKSDEDILPFVTSPINNNNEAISHYKMPLPFQCYQSCNKLLMAYAYSEKFLVAHRVLETITTIKVQDDLNRYNTAGWLSARGNAI